MLSVPTTYKEPKGLYVLEALANGIPVVQPRHGSFPELIEATGGGLLVNSDDPRGPGRAAWQPVDEETLPSREELDAQGRMPSTAASTRQSMADEHRHRLSEIYYMTDAVPHDAPRRVRRHRHGRHRPFLELLPLDGVGRGGLPGEPRAERGPRLGGPPPRLPARVGLLRLPQAGHVHGRHGDRRAPGAAGAKSAT